MGYAHAADGAALCAPWVWRAENSMSGRNDRFGVLGGYTIQWVIGAHGARRAVEEITCVLCVLWILIPDVSWKYPESRSMKAWLSSMKCQLIG